MLLLASVACDKPVEAKREEPAAKPEPVEAMHTLEARVDLQGVVDIIASGEVQTAAQLEAELAPTDDSPVRVDVDGDGKVDPVRIVEVRGETKTTFELRAMPSTEPEASVEAAPLVATLELQADANVGTVQAVARLDASFKAVARISGEASASMSFSGIAASAEGALEVQAEANAFIAWAFAPERPRYVAEVFMAEVEKPEPDPCWPPGHCKHGLWKATDEDDKPGRGRGEHETGRQHADARDDAGKAAGAAGKLDTSGKGKPAQAPDPSDKGKAASKGHEDGGKKAAPAGTPQPAKGDAGSPAKSSKADPSAKGSAASPKGNDQGGKGKAK